MQWTDLAFTLDDDLAEDVAGAWDWLITEPWRPVICSMFGGLFLEKQSGGVFWLECATAEVEQVGEDAASFHAFLSDPLAAGWQERVDTWFLPQFVELLHAAGKRPGPEECFGFTILPVFAEGGYRVDNTFIAPRHEWLSYTGVVHRQIVHVPPGDKVRMAPKR